MALVRVKEKSELHLVHVASQSTIACCSVLGDSGNHNTELYDGKTLLYSVFKLAGQNCSADVAVDVPMMVPSLLSYIKTAY